MELIREIRESEVIKESYKKPERYELRKAARNIIFNNKGQIALLYVSKRGFHKLPGGGVEAGEDVIQALHREELEEVGVQTEVIGEIGTVIEYRDQNEQMQISYCYYSIAKGECVEPTYTQKEIDEGCQRKWEGLDKAIELLENDHPESYFGKFIRERDLTFLRKAKEMGIEKYVCLNILAKF